MCDERICKKRRRAVLYYSDISKIDQSERLEFPARPVCRQSCFARPSGPCQAGNRRAAPERSFWTVENARTCMSLICVKFRNNLFNSWAVSIAEYGCFYLVLINVAILVVKYYFLDSDSGEDKKKRRKKADKRSRSTSRRKERRSRSPRRRK